MANLSIREAAAELGVHPARVTHWIASGKLRAEWVDGAHGPTQRIDSAALAGLRPEIVGGPPRSNGDSSLQPVSPGEALARARAVESYTAGLAATAIAPAVSRLVETIEHLTRENGDLREEIGALKARLDASSAPNARTDDVDGPASEPSDADVNGLSQEQWESLRVRLERLSEPLSVTEQPPGSERKPLAVTEQPSSSEGEPLAVAERAPSSEVEPLVVIKQAPSSENEPRSAYRETGPEPRRGRRPTLWRRLTNWIGRNNSSRSAEQITNRHG